MVSRADQLKRRNRPLFAFSLAWHRCCTGASGPGAERQLTDKYLIYIGILVPAEGFEPLTPMCRFAITSASAAVNEERSAVADAYANCDSCGRCLAVLVHEPVRTGIATSNCESARCALDHAPVRELSYPDYSQTFHAESVILSAIPYRLRRVHRIS